MSERLRDRLIGAWELIDVVEEPVDGSPARHPMGERPIGLILYTPDGYMSAQIMHRERAAVSGDWTDLTPEDYQREAMTYFAYSGPYRVDEEKGLLEHSMTVSLFPGWVGQTQPRGVEIDGDVLHLSTAAPTLSGGVVVMTHIRWRRARAGAATPSSRHAG
jgi:hypothetical protein